MIELFKDGDNMAIRTDASSEDEFIDGFTELLAHMIEKGMYETDWEFQLRFWLPCFVEICCKLRGYKASVKEQRILTSGDIAPFDVVASYDERRNVVLHHTPTGELITGNNSTIDNLELPFE